MPFSLELALTSVPGLSIGIFDRTFRYKAYYGHRVDPSKVAGTLVGSYSVGYEEKIYEACRRAIHLGERSTLDITFEGALIEVHIVPVEQEWFGISGGVVLGIDVTRRVLGTAPTLLPPSDKEE